MNQSAGPQGQEFTGKSVDDAIAEGLRRLGLRQEDAAIEVISRGSRGLFGIGSEPAVVRIARRPATPPAATPAPPAPPAPVTPPVVQEEEEIDALPPAEIPATLPTARPPESRHAVAEEPPGAAAAETPAQAEAVAPAVERPAAEPQKAAGDEDEVAAMASDMLANMVRLMGFEAQVHSEWRDADAITSERHLLLNVDGRDLSSLIGRRGDTLENLQYLLRLMINQKVHRWLNIVVDVEHYRAKRMEHLTLLARRMAEQVATTGRAFSLEPMPPNERRIIHLALRDDERVVTESSGEGERRKVNIVPRK